MPTIGRAGDVDFLKLEKDDLKPVAIVAQGLDNVWVSRSLLTHMLKRHGRWARMVRRQRVLSLADVAAARDAQIRTEYLRALVNGEQAVIGRSFIYNNSAIYQDYLRAGPEREAFKFLVGEGAIVPYLLKEDAPDQEPITRQNQAKAQRMSINVPAFRAWQALCQETMVQCVRLSWDAAENEQKTSAMHGRTIAWYRSMDLPMKLSAGGDPTRFMRDLQVSPDRRAAFARRLAEVAQWATATEEISRELFYKRFVVRDGTEPVDGIFDPDKPFAGQLKQLADLSYNTNVPDALGRYVLTPIDSLPRSALQELTVRYSDTSPFVAPETLTTLLQRRSFDEIQEGLYVKSMGHLSLGNIVGVRQTPEWGAYIQDLQGLLANPEGFPDLAPNVYQRYAALAGIMTGMVAQEQSEKLERWLPGISVVLTIGTSIITALWVPAGLNIGAKVLYSVSTGLVPDGVTTVIGRLVIRGATALRAQADLESSIDFMRGRLANAKATWDDLIQRLAGSDGFVQVADVYEPHLDASVPTTEDINPNINYSQDVTLQGATA